MVMVQSLRFKVQRKYETGNKLAVPRYSWQILLKFNVESSRFKESFVYSFGSCLLVLGSMVELKKINI